MDIDYYDFKEHVDSIEWIHQLPSGMVEERIDMRHSAVSITKLVRGYKVYIGPKDPDAGGDAITVILDKNFQLLQYEVERLDPMPFE